ncbi:MAG TPA: pyruvate carboxyltransferase [Roseiflexaceae bacterium]|nr:pyruvate carboxyltransferase [Roseiflexaceae bacterium]
MNTFPANTSLESPPPFLQDENPASPQYAEALELFALFGYLRARRFGVFSIRESLQAVGECPDGTLQGFHLTPEETWETIRFVDSLGIGVVELPSYPANRPGQALNRRLIAHAGAAGLAVELAAHARCVADDVQAAHEAGFRRVHLYIGASPIKRAAARATVEQIAHKAFDAIRLARELGFTCVRISTEDAYRTPPADFEAFYRYLHARLAENGLRVDGVGIPDSVGISTIEEVGERIALLRRVGVGFDFLECHIHNDTGNADRMYIETLRLCMRMGITMLPDLSILGIGERNGTIGLSSLLEAIYRRLILLYPRKMAAIRAAVREALGRLPSGELFVNRYRDMDAYFYHILARIGFVFDRSPFSANTEFDGSGVHADTTRRTYELALAEGRAGQEAVDAGNSAYAGALPPYDMPLRTPALACFGCGKSNVRHWRERERLVLRPAAEIRARTAHLEEAAEFDWDAPLREAAVDELVARIIRCESIRQSGLTHHQAMEIVRLCYGP